MTVDWCAVCHKFLLGRSVGTEDPKHLCEKHLDEYALIKTDK